MSEPTAPRPHRLIEKVPDGISRRDFMQLMGATIVMGSLAGCREHEPFQEIVPYQRSPESALHGPYSHYSTALMTGDSVLGVRVTSHEGRPIKVEGNPDHPLSKGTTNAFAQASLYDLYDPHRASLITQDQSLVRDWPEFQREVAARMKALTNGGSGLRILMKPVQSPTEHRLLTAILAKYPKAQVCFYSSLEGSSKATASVPRSFALARHGVL